MKYKDTTFYEGDPYTQSVNMQFNSDGTFSMRTWRVKGLRNIYGDR